MSSIRGHCARTVNFLVTLGGFLAGGAAAEALAATPSLSLARTIRTTPFTGTSLSVDDGEGSAFVPNDPKHPNIGGTDSLWLVEDDGHSAWEVNPYTGALKSHIGDTVWQATKQFSRSSGTGTGSTAGSTRDRDIESAAYDKLNDTLYVFSGPCCSGSVQPTVYRLKRGSDHTFHPESWVGLPSGSDFTASAWNPADGKLYVGVDSDLRTYEYTTNTVGSKFQVPNLTDILGMSFSDNGADLYVAAGGAKLCRVDWATKTLKSGWTFDLKPFGVKDSRAVELIQGQFYVYDGYDGRSSSDPLRYAVFVLNVSGGGSLGTPPTADFTWTQVASPPLTVQFTDTSTGSPTGWLWDFGDSSTSTLRNPTHTYAVAGTYPVKLIASNSSGSSPATIRNVNVTGPSVPVASFTWAKAASPPLTIQFTDTSTGSPTSWHWDFGDASTATVKNPAHTYAAAGSYVVKLTASNAGGTSNPATQTVTVSSGASSQTQFPATKDTFVALLTPDDNFGTDTELHCKLSSTSEKRPYFTFVVSGLGGKTVTSAKLRLNIVDPSPSGGSWYTVSPNWIETGPGSITWNNAPPITGTPFATTGAAVLDTWLEIDASSVVKGEGTYGFAAVTQTSDTVYFASRESLNPPQLIVTLQ